MELKLHLEDCRTVSQKLKLELEEESDPFPALSQKMLLDLEKRFGYILVSTDVKFDLIYITATFLHPPVKEFLTEDERNNAQDSLKKLATEWYEGRRQHNVPARIDQPEQARISKMNFNE